MLREKTLRRALNIKGIDIDCKHVFRKIIIRKKTLRRALNIKGIDIDCKKPHESILK